VQTDTTNLVTVFRLISADLPDEDHERFYLPGGGVITKELFVELSALSDIDEVLDRLKGTPYHGMLENQLVNYLEANSIAVLERSLEDFLMRKALSSWRGDPLGIGIIISYLWGKQNEVTNLRIIVKGKSVGMPEERLWRELILV
jgi:V/A-type H+-transporting ATPase subunit C